MNLVVFRCGQCDTVVFPARYFCPHCGVADWEAQVVEAGTIEETTAVRHRVGAQHGEAVHLATVRTTAGPRVIARLDKPMHAGDTLWLELDDAMRVLGHAARQSVPDPQIR
ncbi:Zn-ribbon domain-containing OB-fold protein [Cupriavidus necator]|uniref:Zn-ribbon domain-containing OB-fold protein n=1 Tax=Cupriavidus necator TaxID=106590 RepID=UPI00068EFE6F|nr:zinc ribbon domain-containing protein [Cupriavidus necator]